MFNFFKKKKNDTAVSLNDHLHKISEIKIRGVIFHIKKIKTIDYLDGARVMQEMFSVFKTKEQTASSEKMASVKQQHTSIKKAQEFMSDIIMAGVVKPKLTREKESGEEIYVGDIFEDWALAQELTQAIISNTHDINLKKK